MGSFPGLENYTTFNLRLNLVFVKIKSTYEKICKNGVYINSCQSFSPCLLERSPHSKHIFRLFFTWNRGLGKTFTFWSSGGRFLLLGASRTYQSTGCWTCSTR